MRSNLDSTDREGSAAAELLKGGSEFKQEKMNTSSSARPPEATDKRSYGLCNLGNTCYVNALHQSLYACKSFRGNVLQPQNVTTKNATTVRDLSFEIAHTFQKLHN